MLESPSRTNASDDDVQEIEWNGVPVYWLEAPAPVVGGLLFRVGRADETLPRAGLSHLVEHLALSRFDRGPYQHNGQVEPGVTAFYVRGSQDEVVSHLARVAESLADLPLECLDHEKRVLAAEAASNPRGLDARLVGLRFGPVGYGLVNQPELGLDWLPPEIVGEWAQQWFTAANAAIWMTGPPPDELGPLALPDGERAAPIAPEEIPGLELPAHLDSGTGGVAVSMLAERSTATHAAFMIATDRAHRELRVGSGASYAPGGSYLVLDGRQVHLVLNADCEDRDAARVQEQLLRVLDDLAEHGPTADELEWDRAMLERSLFDPQSQPTTLDAHTRDALVGVELPSRAQLLEERMELTAATVAQALAEALPSMLVLAPSGVGPGHRKLSQYAPDNTKRVDGDVYPATLDWKQLGEVSELIVGSDGLSYVRTDTGEVMSWLYVDCSGAIELPSGGITLIGRDGSWVTLHADRFANGLDALRRVRDEISQEHFAPLAGRIEEISAKAHEQLGEDLGRVASEVDMLPDVLGHDEELRHLARARRGYRIGLLVLTDRRIVFASLAKEREFYEKPLEQITEAKAKGLRNKRLVVTYGAEKLSDEFRDIAPAARIPEFAAGLTGSAADSA